MANSKKVSKGLSYKTKSRVILGVVIALLILIVGGYFTYYTGLPARIIPAVKIVQTVDGKEKTIGRIYTPELNYYRNQILSMYSQYGLTPSQEYLDAINEPTGKTNGQLLYDQAAEQIVSVRLVNEIAAKDPNFYSGSSRYAEYQLYLFELRADNNSFPTVGQYLAANFGSGMTPSMFAKIVRDENIVQEYQEFLKQTEFLPTEEEVRAVYEQNPDLYIHTDFNWYYFNKDTFSDPEASAYRVKKAAEDSATFNGAILEEMGPELAEIIGFDPNTNSTLIQGIAKSDVVNNGYPEAMNEYIFNPENVGKAEMFKSENGCYVALPISVHTADDTVYSYRKIVLNNVDIDDNDYTEEELIAGIEKTEKKANELIANVKTEEDFIKLCKDKTESYDDITTGGYTSGVYAFDFEGDAVSNNDQKLAEWLLDPARKYGDMFVMRSYSNRMVYIYFFDETMESWEYEITNQLVNEKANNWALTSVPTETTVPQISYEVAEKLSYYAS